MIHIGQNFSRVEKELIEGFSKVSPATLGHHLEKEVCSPDIRPVYRPIKLVGTAFTVQTYGKDISAISKAYELAKPGDVLVVNCEGNDSFPYACAGEMSTFKSKRLGIAGLIVDGGITDSSEMEEIGFPCFAKHVTALVGRRIGEKGKVLVNVDIGGVTVKPGDLVVADDDGIVFLNPADAKKLLPDMLAKEAEEDVVRAEYWKEVGQ